MSKLLVATAVAALCSLPTATGAAVLTSDLVYVPAGSAAACSGVNVGKKDVATTFELLNSQGELQVTYYSTLSAGATFTASEPAPTGSARYCRISFTGAPKTVRGSLCVYSGTGTGCVAISQAR